MESVCFQYVRDLNMLIFRNVQEWEKQPSVSALHQQLTCICDLTGPQWTSFPVGHLFRLVQRPPQDLLDEQTEAFLSRTFTDQHLFWAGLSPVDFTALNLWERFQNHVKNIKSNSRSKFSPFIFDYLDATSHSPNNKQTYEICMDVFNIPLTIMDWNLNVYMRIAIPSGVHEPDPAHPVAPVAALKTGARWTGHTWDPLKYCNLWTTSGEMLKTGEQTPTSPIIPKPVTHPV